jgi:hypothetical protein
VLAGSWWRATCHHVCTRLGCFVVVFNTPAQRFSIFSGEKLWAWPGSFRSIGAPCHLKYHKLSCVLWCTLPSTPTLRLVLPRRCHVFKYSCIADSSYCSPAHGLDAQKVQQGIQAASTKEPARSEREHAQSPQSHEGVAPSQQPSDPAMLLLCSSHGTV